jgi:site-specific DNA recombinase
MEQTITKVIVFCRVSSKEQEETGYSLDAQEKLLTEYAAKSDFVAAKVFKISESASGKQIRKIFNEMLLYATTHKIPMILCEKIDRLTRNIKDAAIISDWITENEARQIHFVKENFVLSRNTRAHENLVWDMKVAIARFYTNNLSEEVRKGQKEKLAQGWIPMRAKLGYRTIGEKGHKTHVIDEQKAPLMRKAFELYATGNYSLSALVEIMHKEGLRNENGHKVLKSRLHELLSDPFYCGKNVWLGIASDGQHVPLISKALFDTVQQKLSRTIKNPQYRKHLSVFKAKISCEECGGLITWETQKGHWYGHCNHFKQCSQRGTIRQEKAEDQLFPCFDKVAPENEEVLRVLEQALKESHTDEIQYNTTQRETLTRMIQVADRRIEEAYKDKLDGKMPAALCEKMISESTSEKGEALDALKKLSDGRTAYYEAGYAIHELALHAAEIYQKENTLTEEKRLLLSYVFSNLTLNADKITPNYTSAFEFLHEWMPKLNHTFELSTALANKGQNGDFTPSCPTVLRDQDSNLEPSPYTYLHVAMGRGLYHHPGSPFRVNSAQGRGASRQWLSPLELLPCGIVSTPSPNQIVRVRSLARDYPLVHRQGLPRFHLVLRPGLLQEAAF